GRMSEDPLGGGGSGGSGVAEDGVGGKSSNGMMLVRRSSGGGENASTMGGGGSSAAGSMLSEGLVSKGSPLYVDVVVSPWGAGWAPVNMTSVARSSGGVT